MKIALPYNAKVSTESKHNNTFIEIEDNHNSLASIIIEDIVHSDTKLSNEVIDMFFDKYEDELQDWLVSKGYIFNKA